MRVVCLVNRLSDGSIPRFADWFGDLSGAEIIDSGIVTTAEGWEKPFQYPDWRSIAQRLHTDSVYVGGFHFADCVTNFILAAEDVCESVKICPYLTDFGSLVAQLEFRRGRIEMVRDSMTLDGWSSSRVRHCLSDGQEDPTEFLPWSKRTVR
jgi:hypothetical protein